MSERNGGAPAPSQAAPETGERAIPARAPGPGTGMGGGMPTERSLDFRGSGLRLLRTLRPERGMIAAALLSGVASVALAVIGPRILGHATDLIFAGVIGRQFSSGTSKAAVIAQLRRSGQGNVADLLSGVNFTPGQGIDFTQVGQVLLLVFAIYIVAALFGYLQGWLSATVVQRSLFRLREQAEAKLARLPLSYFDRQPRGELLSRVTNDMDNLAQSLQQALSQVITSLLTIVGVLEQALQFTSGVFVDQDVVRAVFPAQERYTAYFFQMAPTADVGTFRADLERVFFPYGLQTIDIREEIGRAFDASQQVLTLMQAYLGIGLLVGIAGLAVITLRAVVERRTQIGALRAIGFTRRMVLSVFLLEIALIAVLGVGIGVALGIVFAYKVYLVYFADIIVFSIPWDRLLLIVGVASIAAIASTAQPAIRASRIPPAEALRYIE